MIVFSQDNKIIFSGENFSVERNLAGGKEKKFAIVGLTGNNLSAKILACYSEEKNALDEMTKLFEAIESGAKTYSFSNEV